MIGIKLPTQPDQVVAFSEQLSPSSAKSENDDYEWDNVPDVMAIFQRHVNDDYEGRVI